MSEYCDEYDAKAAKVNGDVKAIAAALREAEHNGRQRWWERIVLLETEVAALKAQLWRKGGESK